MTPTCLQNEEVGEGQGVAGGKGGYSITSVRGGIGRNRQEPQRLRFQRRGAAGRQGPRWPEREEEEQGCTPRGKRPEKLWM